MKTIAFSACLISIFVLPAPAATLDSDPASLVPRFMQAWNSADATALSMNFAADADFVSPFGDVAKGRDNIQAFYARAFSHGYAGSRATGEVVSARLLSPDLALLDAQWSIAGARRPDGTPLPDERGILVAILKRDATGWLILALRENEGASGLATFSPAAE